MENSQTLDITLDMHQAYRIARSQGYSKDSKTPVSYVQMTNIVIAAYKRGFADAKAIKGKHKD